jgi:hypothetical protein
VLVVGATTAGFLASLTLVTSRASLNGDRVGSLLGVILLVVPLLFAVSVAAALVTGSFRVGLEHGYASLIAALLGTLAVAVPEGAHWAEVAGVRRRTQGPDHPGGRRRRRPPVRAGLRRAALARVAGPWGGARWAAESARAGASGARRAQVRRTHDSSRGWA